MVLSGAGGWENRKTLATDAKMRKEEEEKEGRKGERRWDKNPSPVHGIRHMRKKPPNHRHRTQANLLRGQTLPRKPAEVSRKLIILPSNDRVISPKP
jgi:hypothetical protein